MGNDEPSQSLDLFNRLKIQDEDGSAPSLTTDRKFIYTPLASPVGRLRLLKITSVSNSILSYSLDEFAFDSGPEYYALSYTWGPPVIGIDAVAQADYDRQQDSRCDGHSLFIGRNVYVALSQLANTYPGAYLWVDAVCINQDDGSERGAQVAQMGDIYANAERVIVWLGDDALYPELDDFVWLQAAEFRAHLFELERSSESDKVPGRNPQTDLIRFVTGQDCPEGLNPRPRWQAYEDFYGRCRWWTRAWVVQEVALAKEIEMFCGHTKLDWNRLKSLANLVRRHAPFIRTCIRRFDVQTNLGLGAHALPVYALRTICVDGGPEAFCVTASGFEGFVFEEGERTTAEQRIFAFLDYALIVVRPRDATDLRDKIYCLFGLMNRFLPPGMQPSMPDYNLSLASVYCSMASTLAEHAPTLSVLSRVQDRTLTELSLPSWVPDYSVANVNRRHIKEPRLTGMDVSLRWKPFAWRSHATGAKLRLKGTKVDVVVDLMPIPGICGGKQPDLITHLYRWWSKAQISSLRQEERPSRGSRLVKGNHHIRSASTCLPNNIWWIIMF